MAKVSVATASRALSNPDMVADGTRRSVREAAVSCGYQINLVARSLRKQRSDSILVLIPEIDDSFYPAILKGIEERARLAGFAMILGQTQNKEQLENAYFEIVNSRRADGLIILDGGLDRLLEKQIQFQVPTIQVLECLAGDAIPAVRIDDRDIVRRAVEHLASLGHRRIAHIAGSANSMVADERIEAFAAAAKAFGCDETADAIIRSDYRFDGGFEAMRQLLASPSPPTAVLCSNDSMALGAMRACRSCGLVIPRDISIIGIDDIDAAKTSEPPLTTFRQPRHDIGYRAMDMLISMIEGRRNPENVVVMPVEFVRRGTTAPPGA